MGDLPEPKEGAVFWEEEDFYACLANEPKVRGHSILVWRNQVEDLTLLDDEEYLKLMEALEIVQEALEDFYNTDKVYLAYIDETRHVHWHLIPRKNDEKGLKLLTGESGELTDTEDARKIQELIEE
jgi:diadenosine tetraphosphate (Ap4A) HIT family hydrolase